MLTPKGKRETSKKTAASKKATKTAASKKTAASSRATGSKPEKYVLSPAFQKYLAYASRFNLLEGTTRDKKLSGDLVPLMEAAHKVIAGAKYNSRTGKVSGKYEEKISRQLDTMLIKAVRDIGKLGPIHGGDVWFE